VAPFRGYPIERLGLLACAGKECRPIPFQVDQRGADGRWLLDHGPQAGAPSGVLGDNDVLLFMAGDAGDAVGAQDLPDGAHTTQVAVWDPVTGITRWAYLMAFGDRAPRSPLSYVEYDPRTDRVRGARVILGFENGVPGYLAIAREGPDTEVNLLDRFKVRATATFLWGLIHFARSEEDLRTRFVAWHAGPIRVIRQQEQWVRIGWGIRSPTFGSYTYFYRDSAELPVGLRLNFPPTYFFGDIMVRAMLDFRDLRGWSVLSPSLSPPIPIDGTMTAAKEMLNQLPDSWFALLGPQITLVQTLDVSPSLASVRRRLLYNEDLSKAEPPEGSAGQVPGIGYQLDRWERVGAGTHQLLSYSYALAPDVDVRQFMASCNAPLQVRVTLQQ